MWRNSRWRGLLPHSRKREAGEKERAPDYRFYRFGRRQFLVYGLEGILLIGLLAWFFYRSLWAMLPLSFLLPVFLSEVQRGLAKQRRQELSIQFRDMILSVAAGLQAGYSVENAFLEAGGDVERLYGKESLMAQEAVILKRGIQNNVPLEKLLCDLGRRSGQEDMEDFAEVFSIAKRSGGNMNAIIRRSAAVTGDKIEVKREMNTLLSSKKYEQKIMNLVPFLIVAYLQITSKGFFDVLYGNPVGIAIMTACLALYLAAFWMSRRIVEIEV